MMNEPGTKAAPISPVCEPTSLPVTNTAEVMLGGLPQQGRVAIAGDWHGNVSWIQDAIPRLHRQAPEVTTIFHLGDFGLFPERPGKGFLTAVDFWAKNAGIERVIVTPGNHEHWAELDQRFATRPGEPIQLSTTIWVLPRGYRFELGGHTWVSFGGAASVDYETRTMDRDWWLSEAPTDQDVADAIAGGPVDVMLTHETVYGGVPLVGLLTVWLTPTL